MIGCVLWIVYLFVYEYFKRLMNKFIYFDKIRNIYCVIVYVYILRVRVKELWFYGDFMVVLKIKILSFF